MFKNHIFFFSSKYNYKKQFGILWEIIKKKHTFKNKKHYNRKKSCRMKVGSRLAGFSGGIGGSGRSASGITWWSSLFCQFEGLPAHKHSWYHSKHNAINCLKTHHRVIFQHVQQTSLNLVCSLRVRQTSASSLCIRARLLIRVTTLLELLRLFFPVQMNQKKNFVVSAMGVAKWLTGP